VLIIHGLFIIHAGIYKVCAYVRVCQCALVLTMQISFDENEK
jgi:hypothetical protein